MFPATVDAVDLGDGWTAYLKHEINGADLERLWGDEEGATKRLLWIEVYLVSVKGPEGVNQPVTPEMVRQMPLSWLVVLMREAAARTAPLAEEAARTGKPTMPSEASQ